MCGAVVVVAAIIAHSCGYLFGQFNQATYLVEPLHRAHPELFGADWLTSHTSTYHATFAAAATWLFRWDDSGVTSTAIAHVAVMMAIVVGVYATVTGATVRRTFVVFVLVASWLAVSGERSLAGAYVWAGYLQPSLVAAVGWTFALAAHARGRPLATGIALAAGGLFHVNFLVLGIGMFALAEVIADRARLPRRLALLLAPQLVALAIVAPELLASASAGDPAFALWVLGDFHAPGHYAPASIAHNFPVLVESVALAVVVAPVAAGYGRAPALRRLVTWCWLAAAICVGVCLLTYLPPLLPLTRLYVWRLGPFAQLAAHVVTMVAAAATMDEPARWRAQPAWRRVAAAGLGALVAGSAVVGVHSVGGGALVVVATGIAGALVVRHRALPALVAATCFAVALGARQPTLASPRLDAISDGDADGVYAWARMRSAVDAVFLTPPGLGRFRLMARRAIFVDVKSPPLVPDELVAWYRRLCLVAGSELQAPDDAGTRWNAMTGRELVTRAHALGADYVVIDRVELRADMPLAPAYANASFGVFATR